MPLGPGNPHGVGFDITQRVLGRESEAQRMCAPERSRVWKVWAVGGLAAREAWHLACVRTRGATSSNRRSVIAAQPPVNAPHTACQTAPSCRPHCRPQVQNPNVLNPVTGKPVAWKLMPGTPCPPMLAHVRLGRSVKSWLGGGKVVAACVCLACWNWLPTPIPCVPLQPLPVTAQCILQPVCAAHVLARHARRICH